MGNVEKYMFEHLRNSMSLLEFQFQQPATAVGNIVDRNRNVAIRVSIPSHANTSITLKGNTTGDKVAIRSVDTYDSRGANNNDINDDEPKIMKEKILLLADMQPRPS